MWENEGEIRQNAAVDLSLERVDEVGVFCKHIQEVFVIIVPVPRIGKPTDVDVSPKERVEDCVPVLADPDTYTQVAIVQKVADCFLNLVRT